MELLVGSRRSRKRQVAFALTMIFFKQQPPERSHKSEANPQKGEVVPVVRVVDSSMEAALVVCLNSASAARVIAASASVTASAEG